MKYRDHEKIVRQLMQQHRMEVANLKDQIANQRETVEMLRRRTQQSEKKTVQLEDLWYADQPHDIPAGISDYELADHEKEIIHYGHAEP
jgi:nitrate reductase cytochrome c-type subunit